MKIKDLEFNEFISESKLLDSVQSLADRISRDYESLTPVFLPVLNGSFMFAADLIKRVTIPSKISFVKVSSYQGTASTGQLKTLVGLDESLYNQNIIIVEDIVDTGFTLEKLLAELRGLGVKSVEVVSLLRKAPARQKNVPVKYVGFDIDDEFVLGYGLDYDGLGRNFKDIYKAAL